jgi:tetrathionate reductase subunit B
VGTERTPEKAVRWAMVIDLRRCIGCHSCSVACKLENRVPLGVFRTWVKIVEKGTYPGLRRFHVPMNCNNCERPVCVEVCPVKATYQRPDGIVLVDPHRCIGCQYCKAACPYEVRYKDPLRHIISKCFWCHHRLDAGLEPACVEACPTGARMFGDRSDPQSAVSRVLATEATQVLHPEHGTGPQVYYLGLDETAVATSRIGEAL